MTFQYEKTQGITLRGVKPSFGTFFVQLGPRSFTQAIVVCDPFFIARFHSLQKLPDFFPFRNYRWREMPSIKMFTFNLCGI